MCFFQQHPQRFTLFCLVFFSTLPGVSGGAAWGLDYEIIASGPLNYTYNYSSTFDGTTFGTLPSFLHLDRLQGGSFRATFRFTQMPAHGGNDTIYFLSSSSGVTSYELLDASGVVVHQGSNPAQRRHLCRTTTGTRLTSLTTCT